MLEVLGRIKIRTARASADQMRVIIVHAQCNAMLPVVTVIVPAGGTLPRKRVTGQKLSSWPGLGRWSMRCNAAIIR